MTRTEDECVNCGLPCLGNRCPNRNVTRFYCDECGAEADPDELYIDENDELCKECLIERVIDRTPTVGEERYKV